jgi:hypothetical protein
MISLNDMLDEDVHQGNVGEALLGLSQNIELVLIDQLGGDVSLSVSHQGNVVAAILHLEDA